MLLVNVYLNFCKQTCLELIIISANCKINGVTVPKLGWLRTCLCCVNACKQSYVWVFVMLVFCTATVCLTLSAESSTQVDKQSVECSLALHGLLTSDHFMTYNCASFQVSPVQSLRLVTTLVLRVIWCQLLPFPWPSESMDDLSPTSTPRWVLPWTWFFLSYAMRSGSHLISSPLTRVFELML